MYEVTTEPPLLSGASKVIVACPFPRVATMLVGEFGTVEGVTAFVVAEEILVPNAFVAVTVNVPDVGLGYRLTVVVAACSPCAFTLPPALGEVMVIGAVAIAVPQALLTT